MGSLNSWWQKAQPPLETTEKIISHLQGKKSEKTQIDEQNKIGYHVLSRYEVSTLKIR